MIKTATTLGSHHKEAPLTKKQNPIHKIPTEIFAKTFHYLSLSDLGTCNQLSRDWALLGKELLRDRQLLKELIYTNVAFNRKDWNACFGENTVTDNDFACLPDDIIKTLLSPCPAYSTDPIPLSRKEKLLPLLGLFELTIALTSLICLISPTYIFLIKDIIEDNQSKDYPLISKVLLINIISMLIISAGIATLIEQAKFEYNNAFPKISPQTKVIQTHILAYIPKTINTLNEWGLPERVNLTVYELEKLLDKCLLRGQGHLHISAAAAELNKPINESRWVLMMKENLPRSIRKSVIEQEKMIYHLSTKSGKFYQTPTALEATICLWTKQLTSHITLINALTNDFKTINYSICQETIENRQVFIGSLDNCIYLNTSQDFMVYDFNEGEMLENEPLYGVRPLHKLSLRSH